MYLPEPDKAAFKPCPPGTHFAICYCFVDLGTQQFQHAREIKHQRKVLISWELPGLTIEDGEHAGAPYTYHQQYTWSMHEKATLRNHLESWRGVPFRESDFGEGGCDVRDMLGKPCHLNLVSTLKRQWPAVRLHTIQRASKSAHATSVRSNPIVYFSLVPEHFDFMAFLGLSDRLKESIRQSPEYRKLMRLPAAATQAEPDQITCVSDCIGARWSRCPNATGQPTSRLQPAKKFDVHSRRTRTG